MDKMNYHQEQMLNLIKELLNSLESGITELMDLRLDISKEGIITFTIIAKDNNE